MKKLLIAAMLFIGLTGFAQEKREKLTPEQRNEKQLEKLTTELNLDASQQAQVKQVLVERSAKAEKLREARQDQKESGTKPSAAEREAFRRELEAEKEANEAKMKSILNADQYTKWKSIQEQNKDKAREKMKEYRKGKK